MAPSRRAASESSAAAIRQRGLEPTLHPSAPPTLHPSTSPSLRLLQESRRVEIHHLLSPPPAALTHNSNISMCDAPLGDPATVHLAEFLIVLVPFTRLGLGSAAGTAPRTAQNLKPGDGVSFTWRNLTHGSKVWTLVRWVLTRIHTEESSVMES